MSAKTLAVGTAAILFLAVSPDAAAQALDDAVLDALECENPEVAEVAYRGPMPEIRRVSTTDADGVYEVSTGDGAVVGTVYTDEQGVRRVSTAEREGTVYTDEYGVRRVSTAEREGEVYTDEYGVRRVSTDGAMVHTEEDLVLLSPHLDRHVALGGNRADLEAGLDMVVAAGCVDIDCQVEYARSVNRALEWGIPYDTSSRIAAAVIAEEQAPEAGDYEDFLQVYNLRLSHQYANWAIDHPPRVVSGTGAQTVTRVSYDCE